MMPKEWERTRNQLLDGMDNPAYRVGVENAIERCYALHCKPQRELTDAEIQREWAKDGGYDNRPLTPIGIGAVRRIIDLHQRKQQEPEKVKFRAARMKDDHERIAMCRTDDKLNDFWEWLEPAQEYEVTLP